MTRVGAFGGYFKLAGSGGVSRTNLLGWNGSSAEWPSVAQTCVLVAFNGHRR